MKFIVTLILLTTLTSCGIDDTIEDNSGWEKEWTGGGLFGITITSSDSIYVGGGNGNVSTISAFKSDGNEILAKQWNSDEMTTGFTEILSEKMGDIYGIGANSTLNRAIIVRFDEKINEVWRNKLPDNGYNADALIVDNDANIIAGMRNGEILKFSSEGKELWRHNISTEDVEGEIKALTVDSKGNVYAGGYTWDKLFEENVGETDVFLVKIASDKTHVWEKQWGSETYDRLYSLAIDNEDNIYVAGGTHGTTEILLKFSSDGKKIWGNEGTGINYQSLTLDSENNIYVGVGENHNLVDKYNADGEKIWSSDDEGKWDWGATGIALDSNGNLYVCGGTNENHLIKIPASEMK